MRLILTITIILFVFCTLLSAENPDTTLVKLEANKSLMERTCKEFKVDRAILSAVIYVERTENYSWEDSALDDYLAYSGLNSSIGFCQVKIKTAYWIESMLEDTSGTFFPGKEFYSKLKKSRSKKEIVEKLNDTYTNLRYASAYLRIMMSRWEKAGFPINGKPEIIGTLYSTGLFYSSGRERLPNAFAVPNDFGIEVLQAMEIVRKLF